MNAAGVARLIARARTSCVILRRAPGAVDGYGNATTGDYATVAGRVDCAVAVFAATIRSGELFTTEHALVINYYLVYLPWSVALTEDDQLSDFITRGESATLGTLAVRAIDVQAPFYRAARCEMVR